MNAVERELGYMRAALTAARHAERRGDSYLAEHLGVLAAQDLALAIRLDEVSRMPRPVPPSLAQTDLDGLAVMAAKQAAYRGGIEIAGKQRDAAAAEIRRRRLGVPYPEFCRHPDKCAGLGCCPRDPCCCD